MPEGEVASKLTLSQNKPTLQRTTSPSFNTYSSNAAYVVVNLSECVISKRILTTPTLQRRHDCRAERLSTNAPATQSGREIVPVLSFR
ncbi:hypothetical protein JOB18_008622 [Solea senegalensis]|uniref:Uncharacterized protein n=1 Tax=Solea senegalensis TaxID=28829 RepID=A0AAV6SWE7_SOLSE|nr:hypothetical protein JOB18_008622 [Solea senegalensis]